MELSDGTILLRPFRPDDLAMLHEAIVESFAELSRWMWWCHAEYSIDDTSAFLQSRDAQRATEEEYSFAVVDSNSGSFLGGLGLNQINRKYKMANLGYWVRTKATGKSVASRATRLGARFGFEDLGLQRIEIVAAVDNLPSQRVAEKSGATREGILRKRLVNRGEPRDAVMFSLVAEDLF